jgi:adenylate cyclase
VGTTSLDGSSWRWRWIPALALLVVAFHFSPLARTLDRGFFDASSRHPLAAPVAPPPSALVLIDENTMDRLGREPFAMRWPFPRAAFAALIVGLERAGAEKIVLDFTFFDQSESAEQDLLLAGTAAASPKVVLGRTAQRGPVFWTDEFRRAHVALFSTPREGDVEFLPDDDGVARRYRVAGSLAAAALPETPRQSATTGGAQSPDALIHGARHDTLVRWHGPLASLDSAGVARLSAAPFIEAGWPMLDRMSQAAPDFSPDALAGALAREPELRGGSFDLVRGRTVFVGANAAGTFDVKPLPIGRLEPGVLLHWTAWANLRANDFIRECGPWLVLGTAALFATLILLVAARWPGVGAPVATALGLVALAGGGAYAGLSAGWFLPPATPVATALFSLLGVVAEGFWLEQRRKREIQSMFGAYVDPGVVAQLVRDPASIRLGGERREATVFFSDLAGFTDLSEKLRDQPERMVEVVNAYLEETTERLLDHGAYVDKYIGDAVMAVFGAPQASPQHAREACLAALATQRALVAINARYAGPTGVTLAVRIGLNTGEMIVGNLGSSRKKNYTVMGDAVNLASRLEGANKHFGTGILLGEETARRVQGELATRPLARLRVKGKLQAVEVHTLHGVPAELPEHERAFLAHYCAGYAAYCARDFSRAARELEAADRLMPGDLTTQRLREESRRFAASPPPDGWEPVLTLDSK